MAKPPKKIVSEPIPEKLEKLDDKKKDELMSVDNVKSAIDKFSSEEIQEVSEYLYHKIALNQFKKTNAFVDKMASLAKESGLEGIKLPKKITHYYVKNGVVKGRTEGAKGKKPLSELFEI